MQTLLVKVFHDETHKGTTAALYINEQLNDSEMQNIAANSNTNASVFIQSETEANKARVFNSTSEIQWCGHGLLAAAVYIEQNSFASNIEIPSGAIELQNSNNQIWIGFEPVTIQSGTASEIDQSKLLRLFSSNPINHAFVGDENGYLILEWAQDFDLSQLDFDIEQLTQVTSRALIVTQKSNDDFDFKLRYFAPTHGVNEDPATGSANRVLASYWQDKLGQSQFVAEQLSSSGAVIISKIEKNKVWISGKVELISS